MVEARGLEVVAVAADVGQGGDPQVLRERALAAGALEALVVDARDEYAERYLLPTLKANARYQSKYPLVSALSRPLICDHLVRAARQFGARSVAHGCTGKGNDQVRFEVSLGALAPDLEVGIKSREVYEVPAAAVLIMAHADLEELTLERDLLRAKRDLEVRYGELVYEGLWFSPLREALDAFNASTQRHVNGTVRVKLEPGSGRVVGRQSSGSLYDISLATYDPGDAFEHTAAEGFVKLWGLRTKTWARAHAASPHAEPPADGE